MLEEQKEPAPNSQLFYQDIMIFPQEDRDKYMISGRHGAEIQNESPLARLKLFGNRNYLARQDDRREMGLPAEIDKYDIKMMIVITMYNENIKELQDSMRGIICAIKELNKEKIKQEEILIVLIADGLLPIKQEFLDTMKGYGFYDESLIEEKKEYLKLEEGKRIDIQSSIQWDSEERKLNPQENVLHLFQTMGSVERMDLDYNPGDIVPYNFFFGIKHLNGGKLDSHFWFFKGLAEYLNPHYTFLVDIGTEPLPMSLSVLFRHLEGHPDCGGVCGEIEVDPNAAGSIFSLDYWLVATQYVEYKISHFLDKAFETFFGFVSVLPGAFSGYRWSSIKDDPLKSYFQGLDKLKLTPFEANMFLAEDRIMCLSIVTNKDKKDILTYIPGARAITDPPKDLSVLMKQRRRWINGSNFASFFVLTNFRTLCGAKHSIGKKIILTCLFIYQVFLSILTFMLVGCSYATFSIFVRKEFPDDGILEVAGFFEYVYLFVFLRINIIYRSIV